MTFRSPRRRLETPRLTLEATSHVHTEGLLDAVLASLDELRPWMAWAESPSLEQTRIFVAASEDGWARSIGWNFTIVHEGTAAGTVGVDCYQPMLDQAQLGYWLRSDLAGGGLMKEAAGAVVEFAFTDVGLHRLELHASPDNIASVRVAEALGFQREGFARDIAKNSLGFYDCLVFGLLESDPRPNPGKV
jgi:ribosomal-protein-serine acetyltransferase